MKAYKRFCMYQSKMRMQQENVDKGQLQIMW